MRVLRTVLCLLTAAVLLMSVGVCASATATAESSLAFKDNSDFIQDYRPVENGLLVYCAAVDDISGPEAYQIKLGSETVALTELKSAKAEPVTYYCLVDVSGSLNSLQLLCAKQMLQGLCDSLEEGDQMLIATVGNEIRASDYLRDPQVIGQKINAIITTNENTNLYRAITDSLTELDTSGKVTDRKCLVVFTDGDDDTSAEIGRTQQEAERKITETRIPVYCMFPPSDKQNAGKTLGSFSRISCGGEAYYLAERTLTEGEIGQAIAADMKGDQILTIDLSGFSADKDELLLTIACNDKAGVMYGDSINIVSSNLVLAAPTPTQTEAPAQTAVAEEDTVIEEPDIQKGSILTSWVLWACVGAGILIAALVVLLLLKKRRDDERRRTEEERRRLEEQRLREETGSGTYDTFTTIGKTDTVDLETDTITLTQPFERPVRFTAVGNKSFSVDLSLREGQSVTFGRNKKADMILNSDDPKLSGVHFGLLLQNNAVRIWDMGSTNGTAVNGVPLVGNSIQIHSGETITAGSFQYRIQF